MVVVLAVFFLLLFAYLFFVAYFIVGWTRTKVYKPQYQFQRYPTLSIIVPVRNEEEHIGKLLADIQSQTYPSEYIEVLVIDDDSTDNTVKIINELNYKNVKVIPLKVDTEIYAYKKRAITLGVNSSNAELIVTTDGDCRVSEHWIACIVDYYLSENKQFITAPVSYHSEKTWFEKIQTIEFQYLIGAAAACIKNGMPNTCNGANMIFTRALFHEIKGYEGIEQKASGDDEMLLHKVYNKDPNLIGFLKSNVSMVLTYAKSDFKGFLQQRIRWASNGSDYTDYRTTIMLMVIFLFNLTLFISIIGAYFNSDILDYLKFAFLFKFIFDGIFIYKTLKFFNRLALMPYLLHVLLFYTPYIIVIGLLGTFSKSYTWKGRQVR